MAAAFIHYFLGIGIASLFGYTGLEALIIGLVGALQDLDFLSFFFYRHVMKSKAGRLVMHRGITHTVLLAIACPVLVLFLSPQFSLLILLNFVLHIFTDYVTAWGVSPFLPFSDKRYSLGLMTIFDVPLTFLSALIGVSGFFSVNLLLPFSAFFGYILLRFALKRRLKYDDLVPMGNFTYAFCIPENDYEVGKVNISGRKETILVKKYESVIDSSLLEETDAKVKKSMLSHFIEYPVYSMEGDSVRIKDARSFLFPGSSRFGFTVFFEKDQKMLYVMVAGKRIELH